MADAQASETTELLRAWANGEPAALEQLTPRVYRELRRIAGHFMQKYLLNNPGRSAKSGKRAFVGILHEFTQYEKDL